MDNCMKIKFFCILVMLAAPACTALSGNRAAGPDETLRAENRLMKNNLDLALRENRVFKEENQQHKAETGRLRKEIRRLHDDIDSLNRKYDTDMAGMTEQYNDISDRYSVLEESTDKKIRELTDLNRNLDKKMKGEISRLNTRIADQKAASEKSRLALEKDFTDRVSSMDASLAEKEATISSMKAMYDEALVQIENLRRQIEKYKAAFGDIDEGGGPPAESNRDGAVTTIE